MLFNSYTFAVFFLVVFALDRVTTHWPTRKLFLLLASYVFYAAWNPIYVLVLLASTLMDWGLARLLDQALHARLRFLILLASLTANLGLLGYFKYWTLIADSLRDALLGFGVQSHLSGPDLLLPVGISFYTFASLSYTLDVYRRDLRADAGFLDYALFVGFFPHLVAGPIVRAKQFLPQLRTPRRATAAQIEWGLTLLILGLFSKAVMADGVFAPVVDAVYAEPAHHSTLDTWAAVLAFSGQIYYDFAGYSLCAIGLALCFGFEFPDNFRYPYAALGVRDFWRRWHISLSTWLRDYLYISLGGNRHGAWRTQANLLVTMALGGLWHGASPLFVLWGLLHGGLLVFERGAELLGFRNPKTPYAQVPVMLLTTLLVSLLWVFFRSPDLATLMEIFRGLMASDEANRLDFFSTLFAYLGFALTLLWQWHWREASLETCWGKRSTLERSAMLTLCLLAIFLCSGGNERSFIYFQF